VGKFNDDGGGVGGGGGASGLNPAVVTAAGSDRRGDPRVNEGDMRSGWKGGCSWMGEGVRKEVVRKRLCLFLLFTPSPNTNMFAPRTHMYVWCGDDEGLDDPAPPFVGRAFLLHSRGIQI
jgi:hypothetical protein